MINGLEGIPGSGKSYEASAAQVLAALKEGRKVITNLPLVVEQYAAIDPSYRGLLELRFQAAPVRGTWDATRVDPETGAGEAFQSFDDGHVEPSPPGSRPFGTVWCYYSTWRHPATGRGPLFVIDECHVQMPRLGTDKAVIEWYKLSRHFGCDVLLVTQRFRQMCQDIAELMAMVIKVRKADVLGKSDSYIRKVHAGYRGAVIQESIRKYEPAFFKLYKSHTQGNTVLEAQAADVSVLSVRVKRWTRLAWGLTACVVAFAVYVNAGEKTKKPAQLAAAKVASPVLAQSPGEALGQPRKGDVLEEGVGPQPVEKKPVAAVVDAAPADPEPYAGKTLHLTGMMVKGKRVIHTFALSAAGAVFAQITSEDLQQVGYAWEAKSDCMGYIRWRGTARAVICDAPARQAGSPERPIVMNSGYSSDGKIVPPKPAGASAPSITTM